MDSPAMRELREHVAHYLADDISLDELRIWLMPSLWSIDREADSAAFQTISKTALYIAEFGAGHRTERELRGLLGSVAKEPPARDAGARSATGG
jgi:hypothetical protein